MIPLRFKIREWILIQLQGTSFKMSLVRDFSAKFGMQGSFP